MINLYILKSFLLVSINKTSLLSHVHFKYNSVHELKLDYMIPRIFPVPNFSFYNDITDFITYPVQINDNLSIEIAIQHT